MDREGSTEQTTIRDSDRATTGGPPGWIAFAVVAVLFLIGAAVVAVIALATS